MSYKFADSWRAGLTARTIRKYVLILLAVRLGSFKQEPEIYDTWN
jgi:hypothetical protein